MAKENPGRPNTETEPHRRYWLVGLVLLGIVVAMLAGAFLLDKQLRPRVGIESTATPIVPSAAKATTVPAVAPTTAQAAPTPTVEATPTTASTKAGGGAAPVPKPTISSVEKEVEQAYLKYWEVYSDALLNLDTTRVGEVAAGEELARIQDEVNGFRQRKVGLRARITHSYLIFDVTDKDAKILDEMLDQSFLVDSVTKEPPEARADGSRVKDSYYLRKIDGVWKVTKSVRQEG